MPLANHARPAAPSLIDFTPRDQRGRRVLLTPGPVTCSRAVLDAAGMDIGAWGEDVHRLATDCRDAVHRICGRRDDLTVTLLPGSGTYTVEATIGTFVPRGARLLILSNGLYGERLLAITQTLGIDHAVLRVDERQPLDPDRVDAFLAEHPEATHLALCHCETTTGVLNPLDAIGAIAARHGKRLIVDTIATFAGYDVGPGGAIDFDAAPIDHIVASSNKCIQSIPGLCCVISRTETLERAEGNARSMSLDVAAQWRAMSQRRRFRFTPPTHALLAMHEALRELEAEGIDKRPLRYRENQRIALERLTALGFEPYVDPAFHSHINTTFRIPPDLAFDDIVAGLRARGFIVFPTQVTREHTLRVGSIGAIGPVEVNAFADALDEVIRQGRRKPSTN